MKTNLFIIMLILLCSCTSQKPIATAHIERIEERLKPIAIGADTIEITEYRLRSTNLTPSPAENAFGDFLLARHNTNEFAFCSCFVRQFPLKQGDNMRANQFSANAQKYDSPILSPSPAGLPLKQGENMRANQFSANAQKHDSPILSPCLRGTSNAEGVKIKSTRAINIQRTKTDTTQTLRITLRPDTVYLPYTTHIRSDTIVVQDRICKTKLQKTQTANVVLILILIAVIIFFIKRQKYRRT